MTKPAVQFVFMTCRAGAETALKEEVAQHEPGWKPSFSRPGFLTFKITDALALDVKRLAERSWTFAHVHGISFGRLAGSQLTGLVEQFWMHPEVRAIIESKR